MVGGQETPWPTEAAYVTSGETLGETGAPPNKGMKLTKPGELRSFAAYPRCSVDF